MHADRPSASASYERKALNMGYMSAGAASTVQEYACEPSVHAPKCMARNPLKTCSEIFTVSQYRRQSHGLHLVQCDAWQS